MSIKCPHCGGRHSKVETVRQCAVADYASRTGQQMPVRERIAQMYGILGPKDRGTKELPAGRYAVDSEVTVEIRRPESGKWKGRYFVNEHMGGKMTPVTSREEREILIDVILSVGWTDLLFRYGKETGLCPLCVLPLNILEKEVGVHLDGSPCSETLARFEAINAMEGSKT